MKAYIFRSADNKAEELKQFLIENLGPEDNGIWSITNLYNDSGTYFFIDAQHKTEAFTFYLAYSDVLERKLKIEFMLEHIPLQTIRESFSA